MAPGSGAEIQVLLKIKREELVYLIKQLFCSLSSYMTHGRLDATHLVDQSSQMPIKSARKNFSLLIGQEECNFIGIVQFECIFFTLQINTTRAEPGNYVSD